MYAAKFTSYNGNATLIDSDYRCLEYLGKSRITTATGSGIVGYSATINVPSGTLVFCPVAVNTTAGSHIFVHNYNGTSLTIMTVTAVAVDIYFFGRFTGATDRYGIKVNGPDGSGKFMHTRRPMKVVDFIDFSWVANIQPGYQFADRTYANVLKVGIAYGANVHIITDNQVDGTNWMHTYRSTSYRYLADNRINLSYQEVFSYIYTPTTLINPIYRSDEGHVLILDLTGY